MRNELVTLLILRSPLASCVTDVLTEITEINLDFCRPPNQPAFNRVQPIFQSTITGFHRLKKNICSLFHKNKQKCNKLLELLNGIIENEIGMELMKWKMEEVSFKKKKFKLKKID